MGKNVFQIYGFLMIVISYFQLQGNLHSHPFGIVILENSLKQGDMS